MTQPSELKRASQIRRKDVVPDAKRTEGKDAVAEFIENEIVAAGRWPVSMTDIADEVGYTRQHVANTLRDYFIPAGKAELGSERFEAGKPETLQIDIPRAADRQSYMWGYLQGWLDADTNQ